MPMKNSHAAVLVLILAAVAIPASAQLPSVPANGMVSAASLLPANAPGFAVSPGGIVSIFGTALSAGFSGQASTVPLPTNSAGTAQVILLYIPPFQNAITFNAAGLDKGYFFAGDAGTIAGLNIVP